MKEAWTLGGCPIAAVGVTACGSGKKSSAVTLDSVSRRRSAAVGR